MLNLDKGLDRQAGEKAETTEFCISHGTHPKQQEQGDTILSNSLRRINTLQRIIELLRLE